MLKQNVQFEMSADRSMQRRRSLVKAVIIAAIIQFPLFVMASLFMPYNITDEVTGKSKIEYVYLPNRQRGHGVLNSSLYMLQLFACSTPVLVAVLGSVIRNRPL